MKYKTDRYYIFDLEWISIHKKVLGIWIMIYEKRVSEYTVRYVNEKVNYLKKNGHFVFLNH
jgi:hypothetical protein